MDRYPDPTFPAYFLGEVVSDHWAAGNRSLDLVVAFKWLRRRFSRPVSSGPGNPTIATPQIPECTLFHALLVESMLEPFAPYIGGTGLAGKKIVLAGVPTGGVDAPEGHLIHVHNAMSFVPTQEWLAEFEAHVPATGSHRHPDPTFPVFFLGEVVSSHWAAGNRSLDLVVACKYMRRRFSRPVQLAGGFVAPATTRVQEKALFHALLIESMLAPFAPYAGTDLTGMKIVLAGVPTNGVDSPEGHLIHLHNAMSFVPTQEWLVAFGAEEIADPVAP